MSSELYLGLTTLEAAIVAIFAASIFVLIQARHTAGKSTSTPASTRLGACLWSDVAVCAAKRPAAVARSAVLPAGHGAR